MSINRDDVIANYLDQVANDPSIHKLMREYALESLALPLDSKFPTEEDEGTEDYDAYFRFESEFCQRLFIDIAKQL
jgi:hypothetical protein